MIPGDFCAENIGISGEKDTPCYSGVHSSVQLPLLLTAFPSGLEFICSVSIMCMLRLVQFIEEESKLGKNL